jgi:predicted nucleotidyltransferase
MEPFDFDTEKLIKLCRENGVSMLGVYGSTARGEATDDSDIDLLIRFSEHKGLLALVRLERVLSETLGRKVDLLTEAAISPYIRENILKDLRMLYDSR